MISFTLKKIAHWPTGKQQKTIKAKFNSSTGKFKFFLRKCKYIFAKYNFFKMAKFTQHCRAWVHSNRASFICSHNFSALFV